MTDIAVVGAGIIGLAHAYVAAKACKRVAVYEKNPAASGASIRNFGMVWPIGQPAGVMYDLALRSREIWCEWLTAAETLKKSSAIRSDGLIGALWSACETTWIISIRPERQQRESSAEWKRRRKN